MHEYDSSSQVPTAHHRPSWPILRLLYHLYKPNLQFPPSRPGQNMLSSLISILFFLLETPNPGGPPPPPEPPIYLYERSSPEKGAMVVGETRNNPKQQPRKLCYEPDLIDLVNCCSYYAELRLQAALITN
ncbi:nucleotidyltransferase-like protein [Corchorus olitorius]|uniref:Nucleotidyltransferase-like protein n=1 Tax=Corchorus olitorius TaxID=93759 RepID=A0A1R3JC94_9ROSI|nr:nucleotidyltransferase-like protein [Corchorus olitorius]